jgi:hypothetical protein
LVVHINRFVPYCFVAIYNTRVSLSEGYRAKPRASYRSLLNAGPMMRRWVRHVSPSAAPTLLP